MRAKRFDIPTIAQRSRARPGDYKPPPNVLEVLHGGCSWNITQHTRNSSVQRRRLLKPELALRERSLNDEGILPGWPWASEWEKDPATGGAPAQAFMATGIRGNKAKKS